tara:strand:+ start:15264 stop:16790 length:1527 start_codon:yes stop_codon:yes gene_type:complete
MPVNTLLQVRRGSSSDWSTANGGNGAVLGAGEIGLDTTIDRIKIGDGTTAWNSLEFVSVGFDDIHTNAGSGVSITTVTDANSQVTGISLSANIVGGDNITLSNDGGQLTINGEAGITLSEGTGIHIETVGSDNKLSVSGLTSNNISNFNAAVDARVTAASVSAEEVRDIMGTGMGGGTGIHIVYDDDGNQLINIHVSGLQLTNIGDITATAAEVNLLDGVTSTTNELNILDGVTASTSEINILDGVTSTATELNLVDGSSAGTIVNSKAVIYGSAGEVNATTLQIAGTSITSTAVELNILDGVTADATEINYLDGITLGTASASKVLSVDSNLDVQSIRNLSIDGDLTVGGTTTTVNSTVVTIDDPIFTLGGDTAPGSDDNKDRGIEFRWHNGSSSKVGFFGFDDSTGKFTFIPDATNTSEVFGGTKGELDATVDFSNLANIDITNTHINASAAIAVSKLASSSVTVGTTEITLGGSSTSLAGMTAIAGASAGSPMTITNATIDGGSP